MCALAIDASARLDCHELSSLCLGRGGELLGVGDASFRIARGELGPLRGGARSASLRKLVEDRSDERSQWEGIAVDAVGHVFVLQEHAGRDRPSHVFVFPPDLDALVGVVELHVPEGDEHWRRSWRADPNARGEAVLLLGHGHLLVVKQAEPIRLIEFGPPDEQPLGLGPAQLAGAPFVSGRPSVVRYEPLGSWKLEPGDEPPLESVNDATVWEDSLYVVSRRSRRVARLRLESDALVVAQSWKLPKAIENPEGLAILADASPVVADDQPKENRERDNVFKLEPLPRAEAGR
jgi:hypothetical protein